MIPHNIGGTGPTYDPRPMVAALEKTEAILWGKIFSMYWIEDEDLFVNNLKKW